MVGFLSRSKLNKSAKPPGRIRSAFGKLFPSRRIKRSTWKMLESMARKKSSRREKDEPRKKDKPQGKVISYFKDHLGLFPSTKRFLAAGLLIYAPLLSFMSIDLSKSHFIRMNTKTPYIWQIIEDKKNYYSSISQSALTFAEARKTKPSEKKRLMLCSSESATINNCNEITEKNKGELKKEENKVKQSSMLSLRAFLISMGAILLTFAAGFIPSLFPRRRKREW